MADESAISQSKAHVHQVVLSHDVHKDIHGEGFFGRINTRLAIIITKRVGSMWCAYAFAVLALISLPAAIASQNSIVIVAWIAQTFLQLVLLPIIIVGQNVQAAASDARALSDHETLIAIHTLAVEIHGMDEKNTEILRLLRERANNQVADD